MGVPTSLFRSCWYEFRKSGFSSQYHVIHSLLHSYASRGAGMEKKKDRRHGSSLWFYMIFIKKETRLWSHDDVTEADELCYWIADGAPSLHMLQKQRRSFLSFLAHHLTNQKVFIHPIFMKFGRVTDLWLKTSVEQDLAMCQVREVPSVMVGVHSISWQ